MAKVELDPRRIRTRLVAEGWFMQRQSGPHDVYRHPERPGRIVMPRHREDLDYGLARALAKLAGWI
jgi:predicted RNA binding protein YcfA (HicA-like mRNA interferase family)